MPPKASPKSKSVPARKPPRTPARTPARSPARTPTPIRSKLTKSPPYVPEPIPMRNRISREMPELHLGSRRGAIGGKVSYVTLHGPRGEVIGTSVVRSHTNPRHVREGKEAIMAQAKRPPQGPKPKIGGNGAFKKKSN